MQCKHLGKRTAFTVIEVDEFFQGEKDFVFFSPWYLDHNRLRRRLNARRSIKIEDAEIPCPPET